MKRIFVLAAMLWMNVPGVVCGQKLEVTPGNIMVDESSVIRASGLQPNEHVSIRAELVDGANHPWSSEADYVADAQGTVDVSQTAPVKGSYKDVSAMGLIWSMTPVEKKDVAFYQFPRGPAASESITFSLIRNGQPIAQAALGQRMFAPGVQTVKVDGQLHGVLFLPNTKQRRPGVLVVGGSEGGLPIPRAAWLASHGYVAFALAYFHYADLPRTLEAIPLEYFGSALAFLMQRPEVSADQIAVMGVSRGGELALQLGSMYSEIKAVVAYVPANVRNPACCGETRLPYAWTWKGQPLMFLPPRSRNDLQAEMAAAIPVEQTHGPILVISGDDDGIWESSRMTDAIVGRLKMNHFAYPVERLNYAHAGHRAGNPEITPAWHGVFKHPISGREQNFGGSAKGDALSSEDAIPKVLKFLEENLKAPVQSTKEKEATKDATPSTGAAPQN